MRTCSRRPQSVGVRQTHLEIVGPAADSVHLTVDLSPSLNASAVMHASVLATSLWNIHHCGAVTARCGNGELHNHWHDIALEHDQCIADLQQLRQIAVSAERPRGVVPARSSMRRLRAALCPSGRLQQFGLRLVCGCTTCIGSPAAEVGLPARKFFVILNRLAQVFKITCQSKGLAKSRVGYGLIEQVLEGPCRHFDLQVLVLANEARRLAKLRCVTGQHVSQLKISSRHIL